MVVGTTLAILALQIGGSYTLIRNVFRWLALVLLAYAGSAVLAQPDLLPVWKGTFVPLSFNRDYSAMMVPVIASSVSWISMKSARLRADLIATYQPVNSQELFGLRRMASASGPASAPPASKPACSPPA
jgi:hypothetical protein